MASRSQRYIEGLILRGFSPAQAAAIAGNFQSESAGDPTAFNPNEGAYGLMQWRLDRKTGLENYAKSTGRDASDPDAQMDWLAIEMTGPEAKNAKAFLSAQDPATASAALKPYIRFANGTENERLQNTLALAKSYGNGQQGTTEMQANAQTGMSDDDLLKAFLGGSSAPASAPSNDNGQMSDDDLLKSFLSPSKASGAPNGAEPGSREYTQWVVDQNRAGKSMGIPTSLPPDEYAVWYGMNVKDGKFKGEPAPPPTVGTSLMDQLAAGSSAGLNAIPVIGPGYVDLITRAKAAVTGADYNSLKDQTQKREAANPTASTIGSVTGAVLPTAALIATFPAAMGASGTIPQQIGMGAASNALLSGADTLLARGGSLEDAVKNSIVGAGLGAAGPALMGGNALMRTAAGAALGGGGTALMGGDNESIARNALIGGGAGAGLSLLGKAGNALLGKTSPETAKLAQKAIDDYGIPIGPGQMSDNPMVRFADDVISKMPFTGGGVNAAEQQAAFNRAVAQTFGENATKVTPDVMAAARDRLGNVFESVAARTPRIVGDTGFEDSMIDIISKAQQVLPDSELKPLMSQWDNIVNKFGEGGGEITGEIYQALTRKNAPLDLAVRSKDPNVRYFATQMRNALDDVFERSAAPEVLADLRQARSQWKAMKTVEDMVEKAPTGDLSPALLMGAARSSYGDMAYGGGGELADLARVGNKLLKAPQSSGTAERLAIMNMMTKGGGLLGLAGTAVLNPGSIPMMAAIGGPALAGTYLAAKAGNALLHSKGLANKLIANSLGTVAPPNVAATLPKQLTRTATGGGALLTQR